MTPKSDPAPRIGFGAKANVPVAPSAPNSLPHDSCNSSSCNCEPRSSTTSCAWRRKAPAGSNSNSIRPAAKAMLRRHDARRTCVDLAAKKKTPIVFDVSRWGDGAGDQRASVGAASDYFLEPLLVIDGGPAAAARAEGGLFAARPSSPQPRSPAASNGKRRKTSSRWPSSTVGVADLRFASGPTSAFASASSKRKKRGSMW